MTISIEEIKRLTEAYHHAKTVDDCVLSRNEIEAVAPAIAAYAIAKHEECEAKDAEINRLRLDLDTWKSNHAECAGECRKASEECEKLRGALKKCQQELGRLDEDMPTKHFLVKKYIKQALGENDV